MLVTNFEPSPIIEAMHKQNRQVNHRVQPQAESQHLMFIG